MKEWEKGKFKIHTRFPKNPPQTCHKPGDMPYGMSPAQTSKLNVNKTAKIAARSLRSQHNQALQARLPKIGYKTKR